MSLIKIIDGELYQKNWMCEYEEIDVKEKMDRLNFLTIEIVEDLRELYSASLELIEMCNYPYSHLKEINEESERILKESGKLSLLGKLFQRKSDNNHVIFNTLHDRMMKNAKSRWPEENTPEESIVSS